MPWLNVPHQVEQQPGWCLPACVAMVSAFWEQPLAQEDSTRWQHTRNPVKLDRVIHCHVHPTSASSAGPRVSNSDRVLIPCRAAL